MLNKETSDMLFETLDALGKHTNRLNTLDKQSVVQNRKLDTMVSDLERQIEASSKDVLIQLLDKGTEDRDQLVKDIATVIATNIANLVITTGEIVVNVETDSIANVIAKLPINNTNNISIDTTALTKDNKQLLNTFKSIDTNLAESLNVFKLMFTELSKREVEVEESVEEPEEESSIVGMTIKRNSDNLIESIDFIKSTK